MLKKQNGSRNIQTNRTKKQCDFNESAKLRALRAQVSYVHHALRAFPVLGFLVPHLPRVLPAFVLHVPLTLLVWCRSFPSCHACLMCLSQLLCSCVPMPHYFLSSQKLFLGKLLQLK